MYLKHQRKKRKASHLKRHKYGEISKELQSIQPTNKESEKIFVRFQVGKPVFHSELSGQKDQNVWKGVGRPRKSSKQTPLEASLEHLQAWPAVWRGKTLQSQLTSFFRTMVLVKEFLRVSHIGIDQLPSVLQKKHVVKQLNQAIVTGIV